MQFSVWSFENNDVKSRPLILKGFKSCQPLEAKIKHKIERGKEGWVLKHVQNERKMPFLSESSALLGIRLSTRIDKNCRGIKRTVTSLSSFDFRHSLLLYIVYPICKYRQQRWRHKLNFKTHTYTKNISQTSKTYMDIVIISNERKFEQRWYIKKISTFTGAHSLTRLVRTYRYKVLETKRETADKMKVSSTGLQKWLMYILSVSHNKQPMGSIYWWKPVLLIKMQQWNILLNYVGIIGRLEKIKICRC
jgi:hypothetical protein